MCECMSVVEIYVRCTKAVGQEGAVSQRVPPWRFDYGCERI